MKIFIIGLSFIIGGLTIHSETIKLATFAGGCFWCMQPPYDNQDGVLSTEVGYMGGDIKNPTYDDVTSGKSGHAEVIHITYDEDIVSYNTLIDIFWQNIDPTTENQQFADMGPQYRTAIFFYDETQRTAAEHSKIRLAGKKKYNSKIVTTIEPASTFYPAEDYHQQYYKKHPLRYKLYKRGSGREAYIERMWGKDS